MALYSDEQVIEWLEKLRGMAGPGADMASAALDLLDGWEAAETELTDLSDRLGDFDEATTSLKDYWAIKETVEDHEVLSAQDGETIDAKLMAFLKEYDRREAESFALQELCAAAGLIDENDFKTDPIPLLRMFLPVEG